MPVLKPGVVWRNFHSCIDDSYIEPGKGFQLLVLEVDPADAAYVQSRDDVRFRLEDLTLRVEYADLYGNDQKPKETVLDFFGRHFDGWANWEVEELTRSC